MGKVGSMVCFDLVRGDLFLCSSGKMFVCVCVFSPLMGRARLCELVYFGVSVCSCLLMILSALLSCLSLGEMSCCECIGNWVIPSLCTGVGHYETCQ